MLDEIDRRMLKLLQKDGRITNLEMATRCNISPSACHERMRKLREAGYIKSFKAILDPEKLDRALVIFVEVYLDRTTNDLFSRFAEAIDSSPEILECYMVAGGFDYLLKVRVRDMGAYRSFLADTLVEFPGVRETRTYAVLEEVKSTTDLPL